MVPTINVITSNSCKVYIEDTTQYLPENGFGGKDEFKYSDTVSIDLLRYNKLEETIHKSVVVSDHSNKDLILIPVDSNGWFSIVHIILPSEKWFKQQLDTESSKLYLYKVIYYSDGNKIYKYLPLVGGNPIEVPLGEITDLNSAAEGYTVYRTEKDYVSICFLRQCYINLCNQIFSDRAFSQCFSKNKIDSELIYKRDLVWMAINVIKYLSEKELLIEAERIIENLQGCNGICNSSNNIVSNGCGCSK